MKKAVFLSMLFVSLVLSTFSQPIIDQNDMPNIGDTIRVNISISTNGVDYTSSGSDHLWDFSSFTPASQRVDTFMNITSTPAIYLMVFQLLSGCNLAGTQPDISTISAISITNVYNFFKKATASYSQLGFGAKFNGTPLPVKYDNPDVTLYFPVTYGEKDSCDFSYNVSIPSMGYYGEKKHRVNYVDGWGTIITPIDTFQAMRVLSKITVHDTIHVDTLGSFGGFAFDYNETEYKWYADNMGIPVMKITVRTDTGAGTSIEYNNKPRSHAGLTDIEASLMFVSLYPNPVNENTNLYFSLAKPSEVEINIYDVLGKNIKNIGNKEFPAGFHYLPFTTGDLQKGIYFIRISDDSVTKVLKLQVL